MGKGDSIKFEKRGLGTLCQLWQCTGLLAKESHCQLISIFVDHIFVIKLFKKSLHLTKKSFRQRYLPTLIKYAEQ